MVAGFTIGLAATGGWAAEMPNAFPSVEIVRIGSPMPLVAPAAPASTGASLFSPVAPSRRAAMAIPVRRPMAEFNRYHPHWTVTVVGQ